MSRADVSVIVPTAGDALERQTAEFVAWEVRRRAEAARFYEKYEELIERHKAEATNWSRRFEPIEQAGYDQWRQGRGEIPLMPLEPSG